MENIVKHSIMIAIVSRCVRCYRTKIYIITLFIMLNFVILKSSLPRNTNNFGRKPLDYKQLNETSEELSKPQIIQFDPLTSNDISCFSSDEGNVLPILDEESIPPDSIFFHETSCKGGLTSRQACTVEQAATMNPNRQIYVIFTGPISKRNLSSNAALTKVKELPNVNIGRIHLKEYAKGTAAENFLSTYKKLDQGPYRIYNAGYIARLLSMYKFGGIYLDLDIVTVANMASMPKNFVVLQNDNTIGTDAMGFEKIDVAAYFTDSALQYYVHKFQSHGWGANGPVIMTKVMRTLCSNEDLSTAGNCDGITIIPSRTFNPYQDNIFGVVINKNSLLKNGNFDDKRVMADKMLLLQSSYDIVKKKCPRISGFYGERFGL